MRRRLATLLAVGALLTGMLATGGIVLAANQAADLDQCANDPMPSPNTDGCNLTATQWVNGNLGSSKSVYHEGDSVPYRMRFTNLVTATTSPNLVHTVTIEWDTTKGGKHSFDYLTTWNRTVTNANPCLGISPCTSPQTTPIPTDGQAIAQIAGVFTMWGVVPGSLSASAITYPNGTGFTGDKSARLTVSFKASQANPVLAWGGHIATRINWGPNGSAGAISGSPYHMRLIDLDGAGGNQDRSLSADAVQLASSITIVKAVTGGTSQDFGFTATGGLTPATFILDVDGDSTRSDRQAYSNLFNYSTYTFTEGTVAGWDLTGRACTVTGDTTGGSRDTTTVARQISITLVEGQDVTCTFTNAITPAPALSVTKVATESSFSAVGNVIHYTITVTNTGNVALTGVTVTDANVTNLDCDAATVGNQTGPFNIALGAHITCTASHTVTQADLNAGSFYNQACADDGTGGAAQACGDVTTPGTQTRTLLVTKVDDVDNYDSVGDVIGYTITVTNSGNVTLTNVAVTDANATGLDCDPLTAGNQTTGFTIAAGAHITCTASHTVTQADIDAGSYYNQACADDGTGGAAQACGDVTTPAVTGPELTVTKDDNLDGGTYDAVGDVITYTIVVTNSGNVTLTGVNVTDANVTDLDCDAVAAGNQTGPFTIAVGDSVTCSASHTITQDDLDAGSFYNQACADDGTGGAAEACGDVTTPGDQNPHLNVTKVDDVDNFDEVGDVITYTITVSNDGNVTLTGVNVTDANVTDLDCDAVAAGNQTGPFTIAVGDSVTCSATHTVTQDDLDAGSFYNQACADDGKGGAAEACGDVTTPALQDPELTVTKVDDLDGGKFENEGDVITYTITVSNSGNVTLTGVNVTDLNVTDLDCDPDTAGNQTGPFTIPVGGSVTCSASHTITAADLKAGSFYNQACADDGEGGAVEACGDVTTPGKSQPTVTTEDSLIPQDSITLAGLSGTLTGGDLYVELRIDEDCGADDSPAYSRTWNDVGNNTYDTDNTVAVSVDATITWCTEYTGNADNAARPLSARGEIVKVDFNPFLAGAIGFGFAVPMMLWGFWSRRKRTTAD